MKNNFQKYLQIINELKIPKGGLAFNKKLIKLTKRFYLAEYVYKDYAFLVLTLKRPNKRHRMVQTITLRGILSRFPNMIFPNVGSTWKGAKKNNTTVNNATIDQFSSRVKLKGKYIEQTDWYDFIRKKVGLKDIVESDDIKKYSAISNMNSKQRMELKAKLQAEYESDIKRKQKEADRLGKTLREESADLQMEIFTTTPSRYPPYNHPIDKVIANKNKAEEDLDKALKNKDKSKALTAQSKIKAANAQISLIEDEREELQKKYDKINKEIEDIYEPYNTAFSEFQEKMLELDQQIKPFAHDKKDVEPIIQLSVRLVDKDDPAFEIIPDRDGRTKEDYETEINLGYSSEFGEVYMTKQVYDELLKQFYANKNNLN